MDIDIKQEKKNDTCDEHGDYEYIEHVLMGKVMPHHCPTCLELRDKRLRKESQDLEERDKQEKISSLFSAAMIPKRFKLKVFDNYIATTPEQNKALTIAKKYADKWDNRLENGGGLIFCGMCGTGKTHLAAAICNQVIRNGSSAVFTSVMKMSRDVKSSYSKSAEYTEGELIKKYIKPDLLVIDEVGIQHGSETEKIILFEILNGRYEDVLPTIIISNLSMKELPEYLGERIIDRMTEGGGATISFTWDSYRAQSK